MQMPDKKNIFSALIKSYLSLMIFLSLSHAAGYWTATELRTKLTELFGSGKHAKIVWEEDQSEGLVGGSGIDNSSVTSAIKCFNTKSGDIRTIINPKSGSYFVRPSFTWNGETVVFTDLRNGVIYTAKFDGTTPASVFVNGFEHGGCWQGEGSHWVIANEVQSDIGSSGGKIYKINLADKNQRILVSSRMGMWPTMSMDGKYVAGLWPGYGTAGCLQLDGNKMVTFGSAGGKNPRSGCTSMSLNGCWPTIFPDDSYYTLYIIEPHVQVRIVDKNDVTISITYVGNTIVGGTTGSGGECEAQNEYNALRWSNNKDYCSFFTETNAGSNAYIFRISDQKYVTLANGGISGKSIGNCDIWFYGATEVNRSLIRSDKQVDFKSGSLHDLRGLKISDTKKKSNSGIFINNNTYKNASSRIIFNTNVLR